MVGLPFGRGCGVARPASSGMGSDGEDRQNGDSALSFEAIGPIAEEDAVRRWSLVLDVGFKNVLAARPMERPEFVGLQ